MFKTLKRVTDGVLTSAYEKVYIVNFEKCPYIPYIDALFRLAFASDTCVVTLNLAGKGNS